MKSSVFWDTTPCSPLKVNGHFGGIYRLHFQGRGISRGRNLRECIWQVKALIAHSKRLLTFNGLHAVISEKMELFMN
jgi:hypothetical protein